MNTKEKIPTLYIPHGGGPCFFMKWTMGPENTWDKMAEWLGNVMKLGIRAGEVKAIVVVSAHWEEDEIRITSHESPQLLFDYYGFPAHTYKLEYPAPGRPDLAREIQELLHEAGIPSRLDGDRGFDHGVFIPFKLIVPDADIPIVEMSLKTGLDPGFHIKVGRALAPLRERGVLIVGSGMSYHNMRGFMRTTAEEVSAGFDGWLTGTASHADPQGREEMLSGWESAPFARLAHPREEHLLPMMVAAGAAMDEPGARVFSDRVMGAVVSAFQFGGGRRPVA